MLWIRCLIDLQRAIDLSYEPEVGVEANCTESQEDEQTDNQHQTEVQNH